MVAFPPCKINLGLNVVNRRDDGYHNIETCFYPLPRTDVLEIVPSVEFKLSLTGLKVPGSVQENICTKAYDLLKKDHALPAVAIHLHKTIPSGSGLGGGSSDGTWTLRILDSMFNLRLPTPKLAEYAGALGSDCPFFLFDKPMIGTGRGEILSAVNLSLKGKVVVIVNSTSQSEAEWTTMAFQSSPNVKVIGSKTAGADGDFSEIVLPGGLNTGISGIGVFYPDGKPTQRVGVKIDEVIYPTINGIKLGKDELLEKANATLNKGW